MKVKDGCTCKRTTWDGSFHELHELGCPVTLPPKPSLSTLREAVVDAAVDVGDSNFRRLEEQLRKSGWPSYALKVQKLRIKLEDFNQAVTHAS